MPIGVPRIIYCWGEELPAQWTDIYNFIFRRRMVFLMQYLDDELCNQICGLLINIHMEDRSKELEKKEMENSGLFKSSGSPKASSGSLGPGSDSSASRRISNSKDIPNRSFLGTRNQKSIEDLMISEEDLGIDENHMLERHTLQKISLEWLNWNAQFFDYSPLSENLSSNKAVSGKDETSLKNEPYLFYLAELLSKDFMSGNGESFFDFQSKIHPSDFPKMMMMFKKIVQKNPNLKPDFFDKEINSKKAFEVYSAFRLLALNHFLNSQDYNEIRLDPKAKQKYMQQFNSLLSNQNQTLSNETASLGNLLSSLTEKDLFGNLDSDTNMKKALTQRQLRRAFSSKKENASASLWERKTNQDSTSFVSKKTNSSAFSNYLNLDQESEAYMEYRDYYRKQTERTFQDEESKKVFMIINSFGGSVGNGITVHDALQFIKAGSMTLGLGVAASAASLALAGGTIGERYVTEGCHVMIHQPEGGLTGQASDIWIDSQEIMKIRLDVAEIYSLSTYRPRHKILRDLDRDFYLTATETVYYGLADEIATNEVISEIIEMTSKVWDYHESQQQRLLETRETATANLDTQTQS